MTRKGRKMIKEKYKRSEWKGTERGGKRQKVLGNEYKGETG